VTSKTEELIARSLRACLAGLVENAAIEESEDFHRLMNGLEFYLPAVLNEVHSEWRDESMDGFHLVVARKTGPREAEFIGLCILISDQTLTPIHVRLRMAASENEIEWLECKVGESGEGTGRMVRLPYDSPRQSKLLVTLPNRLDTLDWAYHVGFGERQAPVNASPRD
jgi:hypothetical protein